MKAKLALALSAAVTLGSMAVAQAQSAPGAAGSDAVIPEKQQPAATSGTETGRSSALSDRLDSTNGGIKPQQNVDPGMTKTPMTPGSAATPVLSPPGTPGGPPGPQAK